MVVLRQLAAVLAGLVTLAAVPAWAQDEEGPAGREVAPRPAPALGIEDPPRPRGRAAPDGGNGVLIDRQARYPRAEPPTRDPEAVLRYLREGAQGVPLHQVFEEMVEELVADFQDAPEGEVSPLAVRRVRVSSQLSGWFADEIEAQVAGAIQEHTPHRVRRCLTCDTIRSRVTDDRWVVTVGIADQAQLRREAELLRVRAFMDIRAAYYPEANIASLAAIVFSAEDGTVLWSRSYRSDATTAAILRTGERYQTRAERVEELQRRLEMRPHLSHQVFGGAAFIPYSGDQGTIFGGILGYRLLEHFGDDMRWSFSLGGAGFLNLSDQPLIGGFVNASLMYDLLPPNLNFFQVRTGPTVGAFFAGQEGNSFVVEWGVDGVFQFLLGIGISAYYFVPVEFAGADLGGFGGKARLTVNFR